MKHSAVVRQEGRDATRPDVEREPHPSAGNRAMTVALPDTRPALSAKGRGELERGGKFSGRDTAG